MYMMIYIYIYVHDDIYIYTYIHGILLYIHDMHDFNTRDVMGLVIAIEPSQEQLRSASPTNGG